MSEQKKKGANRRLLWRILRDAKHIRGWLILSAFVGLVAVLLALIGPELLGGLTDTLYTYWSDKSAIDMGEFGRTCLLLCGIYGLAALCSLVTMFIMNNVVSKHFTCALRIRISEKIKRLPVSFVDKTPNGEIIARMTNDVSVLGNTVHNFINMIIEGALKLIGITVIIFMIQPVMAASVIVFVPLSLVLSAVIAGRSMKHFSASREVNGRIYALTEEDYTGFATVKAFNLEDRQNGEHAALCAQYQQKLEKGVYLSGVVSPLGTLTNNFAYIAICLVGGYYAVTGTVQVGDVVAFVLYAKLFAGPLESIASGLSTMQRTFAFAQRVYALLDEPEMTELDAGRRIEGEGNIRFEHVYFAYEKDKPLIEDLNIDVRAGQKVAIVGPTGGGKTTIVNLLMRFYDIDRGRITVDGVDIMDMQRSELRNAFSMVLQDTWLFSGTIYDNIAYGKENATREEVLEAARKAHIDFFIDTLPDGFDTMINEESTNISSGQKQLLTIARAYLANRRILILDEATSNVDTRTEILIQETMDALMETRTSFVIAHRLSTIVDADVILVVDNGRIVEQGSHAALLKKGGFYAEIYNSQYELLK